MIVLVKDIPAYAFSSGLNELVFATDQNKAVFSLTVGEKRFCPKLTFRILPAG